jgi:type IV pilus assembly protein PilA
MQEAGGDAAGCSTGSNGIPTFTATKEVASATVTGGQIVATFAGGIASDIPSTATFTLTPSTAANQTTVTWNITTTAANATAVATLTKNNLAAAASGS